ncbi:hypothetical protein RI367_001830 [Sorochytrium milnesiophthora]
MAAVSWRVFTDIVILLVTAFAAAMVDRIPPFQQLFYLDDEAIKYPMALMERVDSLMLIIYGMVIPLFVTLILSRWFGKTHKAVYFSAMGLLYALTSMALVVHIIKVSVGRLRPDFLDRCKPTTIDTSAYPVCTGDPKIINDGRKSFPSGHAATSWTGYSYIALYCIYLLEARFGDGHDRGNRDTVAAVTDKPTVIRPWIPIIKIIMFVPPFMIGVTRLQDYRHHWQDVLVGSLIGFVAARYWLSFYKPVLPFLYSKQRQSRPSANVAYSPHVTSAHDDAETAALELA